MTDDTQDRPDIMRQALAEGFFEHDAQERLADYLRRGKALADLSEKDLTEFWVICMQGWVAAFARGLGGDATEHVRQQRVFFNNGRNEAQAEFLRRGIELPTDLAEHEIAMVQRMRSTLVAAGESAALDEIEEKLRDFRGRKNRPS